MTTRSLIALVLVLLAVAGAARAAVADPVPPTLTTTPPSASPSAKATFAFSHADAAVSFECNLDGVGFTACTSPQTYEPLAEGGHTFAVRAVDTEGFPSTPASFAWTVDLSAPSAPAVTGPPPRTRSATAEIGFSHGENGLTFVCRIDGGAPDPCTSPQTYSGLGEGAHTAFVRAVDAAGNVGPAASHSWTVDATAPSVELAQPVPASATNDSTPLVAGTAGTAFGDASTVRIQVRQGATGGGQPIRSVTANVAPTTGVWGMPVEPALPEGTYNVRAEQSDDVGNEGESERVVFTVDVTPPAAPTVSGPPARTAATSAQIQFSHAETGLTFLCRLDGGAEAPCTSPKAYTGLAEGGHSVSVRARDAAGNVGPAASHSWTVDTTAPALTLVQPVEGTVTNDSTPLVAGMGGTALGDAGTVQIQVRQGTGGGQPFRSLTATVAPTTGVWGMSVEPALPEGTYNVRADQSDDVGNQAESERAVITVDVTPPAAPTVTGPPARTASTSAQIQFTHAELGLTFLCRLDGGVEAPCTSPKTYTGLAEGGHVVSVRARDAAGNVGAAASRAWTVDTTAPLVSLVSPAHGSSTNDTTPTVGGLAGTATGDEGTVSVQVRQGTATGGQPFLRLTAPVNQTTGAWSVTVTPALAPGTYTVKAEQSDDVGNKRETGHSTFTVDLSVPSVTLSAPASGTVTQNRSPFFSGTSDQASVALDVFAGSPAGGSPLHTVSVPVAGGGWSVTLDASLADGVYTAAARATNAAGTSSSSNAVQFVVDNGAPAFTVVPEPLTLEQTARAGEVVAYSAEADDALDPAPEVVCTPSSGSTFPLGSTEVECTVTDWAGLAAEAEFTVTVENTIAPAPVEIFAARSRNGSVLLSWRPPPDWDHEQVVISRATRGKGNWRTVLATATATSFVDRNVVNDREYVYRVTSVDVAGNLSPVVAVPARPSAFVAPGWGASVSAPPLLRWAKVKRARYYNVQIWHGGRKVLSRWPTVPRLQLKGSWKFQGRRMTLKPGLYLAYAWPGFGPKSRASYGARVGWTKFVVP